jgi:hypothetical protein
MSNARQSLHVLLLCDTLTSVLKQSQSQLTSRMSLGMTEVFLGLLPDSKPYSHI